MKDITFLNIIHKLKISFQPPFSSKIADSTEIVRIKGSEKQAIVSWNGPKKETMSLLKRIQETGNESPVTDPRNKQ